MQGTPPDTKFAFVVDGDVDHASPASEGLKLTPAPTQFETIDYSKGSSGMTFTEAFANVWMYDNAITAVANAVSKPNKYDAAFVAEGGVKALEQEMIAQYGRNLNEKMLEDIREVTSEEDADHVRKIINNKMLAEQGWQSSTSAGLLATVVAPENLAMGWVGTLTKSAKATHKLYSWLDKSLSKKAQTAVYGTTASIVGGVQAAPGVLWNYDDNTSIPIAMALGGALGVGIASAVDPNRFISKVADSPASKASLKPNGIFGTRLNEFLSMADELDALQEGLGARLLGNPGKGIKADIDSAGSRIASLTARASIPLHKLEQSLKALGLTNQSAWENIKQAIGLPTTATTINQKEVSRSTQRVMAFIGNEYNYNRSIEAQKEVTDELLQEIDTIENALGITDKTTTGTVRELADRVNVLRDLQYKAELDEYNKAVKDITKQKPLKEPLPPAKYTPPMAAVSDIAQPDPGTLTDLERGMVDAYRNSGVAEHLGKMVNEQGNGLRKVAVDKNYFHTRFNLNKMDEIADRISESVKKARLKEADVKQAELDTLRSQLIAQKRQEAIASADHKRLSDQLKSIAGSDPAWDPLAEQVDQARKLQYDTKRAIEETKQRIKDNEDFVKRIRGSALDISRNARMREAYIEVFGMMGEQMADAIKRCTGSEVDPRKVGAFLAMKNIPDVGHQAMRDALASLQLDNERKIADLILQVGGDLDVNDKLLQAMEKDGNTGLVNLIKQATELHSVNNLKLVGEASAFKSRFLWDYNKPSKITGIALNELLDDDFLNTVTRNIQEECGRVGLSHVYMKGDDGRRFYLNSGANITRAQSMIHDYAKDKGYGDSAATDLATMTFDALLGRATGEKLGPRMQVLTQLAQMVQLKNSGLYNIVDTVNVAHAFGTAKMMKHFIPAIKMGLGTSKITQSDAKSLKNVVSRMYAMEARVRPDLVVLSEDMTDVSKGNISKGIMNSAQYMRWVNGQAQVAQWQANMCASIYEELLETALKTGKWDDLDKAGHTFTAKDISRIRKMYDEHGLNVEDWGDSVIAEKVIRNCFDVTTNTALQVRRGDRPRFLNTAWGKVCFAYQSFVFAANNKLTRRFMNDQGMLGASAFLAKQLPLAALMAISVQTLNGKDPFADTGALTNSVINAWSGLGVVGWAGSFLSADIGGTAPGLGLLNTARNGVTSLVTNGDPTTLVKNVPLLGGFLPYRMAIAALCGTME